ncbi:nucleoside-triphosphatase [Clostridium sardiniense]|uniref:nucleoside-triphosphatase n=1 Tax=Clostridium sardiniense TaxID=29369 RepID=UPI0019576D92|nr:nucleoside-triphosphatase [Clostridium sardiniense]MBM7833817.1 nucleoside-triphosphatase [Clostridium sardiniense]
MKYKNILITGKRNCGKSTLIDKILGNLNLKYGGYRTLPYYINGYMQGYYLHGYVDEIERKNLYSPISIKVSYDKCVRVTKTFDILGTYILRTSRMKINSTLILLDEIGFLEDDSEEFKLEIHNCLSSKKFCLGVLKDKDSEFLNSIKIRNDTLVINIEEIRYEDRKIIQEDIENYIRVYQLKELSRL